MTTDAWRDDAWTDTKTNPDEPDWYYERGLPNSESGGVVVNAILAVELMASLLLRQGPQP